MPLELDYRPESLTEVVGNDATKKAVDAIFTERLPEDLPHAWLFTGPSGTGKTTMARIVANLLQCSDRDFKELDAADFRGIDTVREIRKNLRMKPMKGRCRVWLLDECHQLTKDAQEALLKALEDTPDHVYFILATTDPQKLKPTLKRRCKHFTLSPVTEKTLIKLMTRICREEKVKVPEDVMEKIAEDSTGSPGIALSILDSIVDLKPEDMMEVAEQSAKELNEAIELCRALMKKASWKVVSKILKGLEQDPESVRRAVLGYMNSVLLNSGKSSAFDIMTCFEKNFFDTGKAGLTMACFEASSE